MSKDYGKTWNQIYNNDESFYIESGTDIISCSISRSGDTVLLFTNKEVYDILRDRIHPYNKVHGK